MSPNGDTSTPLQILDPAGSLAPGAEAGLTDDQLREGFRLMLLSRMFDERAFTLQRQGRLGTFSPTRGQEATSTGVSLALRPETDWLVPQYREFPALIRHGWALRDVVLYYRGHPHGWPMPDRLLNVQIALAAQLPHATGLAWGLAHQGSDAVVVAFCGDGGSSEGDFHEALNFAGVLNAPVVFVLQNNQWAISTPVSLQTAASSLADRAAGYGIAGRCVDGNDLLAVYATAREAVERARSGGGPTLIEARTFRLGPHNTIDEPSRYVAPERLEEAEREEPLIRVRAFMRERGLLSEEDERAQLEEIGHTIDTAVAEADAYPPPDPAEVFEHVYATNPARLTAQRERAVAARSVS